MNNVKYHINDALHQSFTPAILDLKTNKLLKGCVYFYILLLFTAECLYLCLKFQISLYMEHSCQCYISDIP